MITRKLSSNNKLILGVLSAVSIFLIVRYLNKKSLNKNTEISQSEDVVNKPVKTSENKNIEIKPFKSIVIGDSQSFFISKNNSVAKIIGASETEKNLWKSETNLNWLKKAVDNYPISKDVKNIIVSTGTNSGYNTNEDVAGLFNSLKNKFPNAKIYVVKGSWGWGNIKSVTESKVNKYYQKFKDLGMIVLSTPIGKTINPHKDLPVYRIIGKEIEKQTSND